MAVELSGTYCVLARTPVRAVRLVRDGTDDLSHNEIDRSSILRQEFRATADRLEAPTRGQTPLEGSHHDDTSPRTPRKQHN